MEHKPEYADNDQTIFRKPKDRDHPYVVISKTVFEDAEISWKAKGMMGYLLSRPDDWTIILGDLVKRAPEGRGSVRSILKELEQHGYLLKRTLRDEHGRWAGVEMIVLEHPAPLEQRTYREKNTASKTPHTEKPHTVEPPTVECPLLSTDVLPCTDLTKEEPPLADSPVEDIHPDPSELCRPGLSGLLPLIDAQPTVEDFHDGPIMIDDIAETEEMFEPPKPSPHEPVEQGKARRCRELGTDPLGVAAVVAQNRAAVAHPDGGDPSRDGDPWTDRPVREWCAFIRLPYENSRVAYFATELSHIAVEVHASAEQTGEAIRKMTLSPSCEWLRTAHDPKHTGFAGTLLNVLNGQELPEGKANDGARGGRAPEPVPAFTFVDPDWLGVST